MIKRLGQAVSTHRRHIFNISSFVGTRLVSIVVFALSVPFFIRHTSDAEYGIVAIGFSLLGLSTLLDVAIGYVITQSVGRRLARSSKPNDKVLHGLFSVYLYLAVAATLILLTIVLFLPLNTGEKFYYGSLAFLLPGMSVSGVVAAIFLARNDLTYINLSRFGFELGKGMALVFSALIMDSYILIGPVLVLVIMTRAFVDYQALYRRVGIKLSLKSVKETKKYYRLAYIGISSFLAVILMLLVSISDKILIKEWFSISDVAYYSVAFDVNTKAYLLVNAVNAGVFALILKKHASKSDERSLIKLGILSVCFVGAVYYVPMMFYSEEIIATLVSRSFAESSSALASIMAVASLTYLVGNVYENAATAMGQARKILKVYVFGVILYFICIAVLKDNFGLIGFVYAYLVLCCALSAGFFLVYYSTRLKVEKVDT